MVAERTALNADISLYDRLNEARIDKETKAMAYALGPQHNNIVQVLVLSLDRLTAVEEVRKLDFMLILELSLSHEDINQLDTLDPPVFLTHCIDAYDEIFELEFHVKGILKYFLNMFFS